MDLVKNTARSLAKPKTIVPKKSGRMVSTIKYASPKTLAVTSEDHVLLMRIKSVFDLMAELAYENGELEAYVKVILEDGFDKPLVELFKSMDKLAQLTSIFAASGFIDQLARMSDSESKLATTGMQAFLGSASKVGNIANQARNGAQKILDLWMNGNQFGIANQAGALSDDDKAVQAGKDLMAGGATVAALYTAATATAPVPFLAAIFVATGGIVYFYGRLSIPRPDEDNGAPLIPIWIVSAGRLGGHEESNIERAIQIAVGGDVSEPLELVPLKKGESIHQYGIKLKGDGSDREPIRNYMDPDLFAYALRTLNGDIDPVGFEITSYLKLSV